jgi:ATP/ADP translocase
MIILNSGSGWEYLIFIAIFLGIILPVALFIVGLVQLRKNHKRGKTILIIATVYSIISFGLCGGFGL